MSRGASPAGVEPGNELEVSHTIREMFGRVAPRYDLLNRLLSLRIDQYWRNRLVRRVLAHLERPNARILDLCCGTGDLLIALETERRRHNGSPRFAALGSDFCRPMLTGARRKLERKAAGAILIEADALRFPLPDESLDLITIAWGFRNFANYERGLEEMYRLLKPNGCLAMLEFSRPGKAVWGPLFDFYFRRILPRVGNAISGAGNAYSYLQQSVGKFLTPEELTAAARDCGFKRMETLPLTGGITVLYVAYK